jgi:hypothetical protein
MRAVGVKSYSAALWKFRLTPVADVFPTLAVKPLCTRDRDADDLLSERVRRLAVNDWHRICEYQSAHMLDVLPTGHRMAKAVRVGSGSNSVFLLNLRDVR